MPKVFGIEFHMWCLRHLRENFLTHAGKYGLKRHATKDLLNEMLNSIACAPSATEHGLVINGGDEEI